MFYIRTDINEIIATGHVMRCLSIADAAKRQGEDVIFILSDENGKKYIEDRGYKIVVLNFRETTKGNAWNPLALPYQFYKEGLHRLIF